MKRIFLIVLVVVAIGYFAFCTLFYLYQRSFIYFPVSESQQGRFENVTIESQGEKLRILTRITGSSNAVIYFGGNADDVSSNLGAFAAAISEPNLFLVNYRGYGGSTGSPSEAALFADAVAVFDHVKTHHANVSVIGRSLGTGVAVYLASVREIDKLILITPYDSIENVAKRHLPIFPVAMLLEDKFDSVSRMKDVTAKTLIILAESDRTIPRENSLALVERFPLDQVSVTTLVGTNHDNVVRSSEYLPLIEGFLSSNPQ